MNWFDISILVIIFISAAISIMRGFMREALSLLSWVLSFWVAISFASRLEALLREFIQSETVRISVSFAALFFLTLIAGSLVLNSSQKLLEFTVNFFGQHTVSITALLGLLGYSLATLLGFWLIISIFRSGKM